jgi:ribonucleoside-diphosphate reductase alpha chain
MINTAMAYKTDSIKQGLPPTPALPEDLPQVNLTENARQVLTRRYVRRGDNGQPVETVEEMFWRVAYHIARVEEAWGSDVIARARQFYALLTSKRFFPNSPTFTGAGTPLGQLAACFVLPISDDMGRSPTGIFQTLRSAALIQQTGGGNGFSFSRLRPKGSLVKSSAGQATGPVGFLRVYDHAFGEVAQGGSRRGANMAVLRVDHPDIEDFITCKTNENAITNFNISVGIPDAFMQAVAADADWDLRFPDVTGLEYRGFDGTLEQAEQLSVPIKVYQTVRARELFQKIVSQAHHNGEPGVLFLDAANRSNPVPHLYQLEATNPCFIGSTRISTDQGWLTIQELAENGSDILVAVDERAASIGKNIPGVAFRKASLAWQTRRDTPVLRLATRQGYSITATPDHPFLTAEGEYRPLSELRPGDRLLIQSGEGYWSKQFSLPNHTVVEHAMATMGQGGDRASSHLTTRADFKQQYANLPDGWSHDLGFVVGTLVGDGWLSPSSRSPVGMVFGKDKTEAQDLVMASMEAWFGAGHLHSRASVNQLTYGRLPYEFFRSLGVGAVPAHLKRVPDAIWQAPREAVIGFLQGLFTADGTVNRSDVKKSCSIRLASASNELLQEVQLLLLNLGIASKLHMRRQASLRPMPDGKGSRRLYAAHADYELIIDKTNRDAFLKKVGFIDVDKQQKALSFVGSKTRRSNQEAFEVVVKEIEPAGQADVYDLTEPATHSLIAAGFVAHNCGEQWLGPFENCCLGSVNLAQHFAPDGKVDWEGLRQSIVLSTIFLDDVVDANMYVPAVPELEQAAHRARRIGLGIMGLADLMYHTAVRYGSPESLEFASQVMEFVRYHAMLTSIDLSAARGAFPAFLGSHYDPKNAHWQPPQPTVPYTGDWGRPDLDWDSVLAGIRQHGIRNAAQNTIAPTGTIATVAGCEGYGCEPVFALAYVRHVNDNGKDLQLAYASPLFDQALVAAGLDAEGRQAIIYRVMQDGTCQDVPGLSEKLKEVFVVSQDIPAEDHVRMQAALQAFVDNSLSKTINFPPTASVEDVATAYQLAWELGCKGITVYVTGSREKVVLETKATFDKKQPAPASLPPLGEDRGEETAAPTNNGHLPLEDSSPEQLPIWRESKKPRPRYLKGFTYSIATPLGKAFITINENGGDQPFEVFIITSKAGSDTAAVSDAIGRLISYTLRLASSVEPRERLQEIIRQLSGIGGGRPLGFGPNRVRSLPDGVAHVLSDYLASRMAGELDPDCPVPAAAKPAEEPASIPDDQPLLTIGDLCPECGQAAMVNEEGCHKCYACGYSEC